MKFGRIASILVILVSIGSLYCVQMLRQGRDQLRDEKATLTQNVADEKAKVASTETKLKEAVDKLVPVEKALAQSKTDHESTKKVLTTTTQEREKLKTSLAEAQQKLPAINKELVTVKESLKKAEGTITKQAGVIATIAGYKKQIADLTAENKALGSKIEVILAEIKRLEVENGELRTTPINVRGHVAGVENRWNFIILDIGQDQQVRKNTQFLVYRDKTFICKAQVLSVAENTAVAEVLPEFRRSDPRIGDLVIH